MDKKQVLEYDRIHSFQMSLIVSVCLLGLLGAASAAAVSAEDTTGGSSYGLGLLARSLEKCGGRLSELGTCLRVRAVGLLDRALHSGPIEINDYLSLAPDSAVVQERTGRALSDAEIEAALPEAREEKEAALDQMIADKMSTFLQSRTFKFTMPTEVDQEGRGKKKKEKGMGMVLAVFFSMMLQMAMAKIALLAGKALLVGKIALVLSAIIGLKKLVSGGGESHQVVYADHGGHSFGRSVGSQVAHEMAYAAQARSN